LLDFVVDLVEVVCVGDWCELDVGDKDEVVWYFVL